MSEPDLRAAIKKLIAEMPSGPKFVDTIYASGPNSAELMRRLYPGMKVVITSPTLSKPDPGK